MNRETDIIQWGVDRNILGPTGEGMTLGQWDKTYEETLELREAILCRKRAEVKDAIGDIYVTLVMQAQMWQLTMDECIEAAWNQIKDRKGRMVNGIFVKES